MAKSRAMLALDPLPCRLELVLSYVATEHICDLLLHQLSPTRLDTAVGMKPTYSSAAGTTAGTSDVTQPAEGITPTSSCPEVGVDESHHKHEPANRTRADRAVKTRDILDL